MKFVMDLFEMGVGDVGVNLGSADIRMAEERLDRAEVGTVHEEVGRERMAEGMRSDVLSNAGEAGVFFNHALDRTRGEAAEIAILSGGAGIFRIIEEKSGEGIMADAEVILYPGGGGLVDENWTVLAAFAADDKFATV